MFNKIPDKQAKSHQQVTGGSGAAVGNRRHKASRAETAEAEPPPPVDTFVLKPEDARDKPYEIGKDQVLAFDVSRSPTTPLRFQFYSPLPQPEKKVLASTPRAKPGQLVAAGSQTDHERYYWTPEMRAKCGPSFSIGVQLCGPKWKSDEVIFRFVTRK